MTAANRSLVIFGATGDLAQRMLFPSLYFLESDGLMPKDLSITGCSRSVMADGEFSGRVEGWVKDRAGPYFSDAAFEKFRGRVHHAAVEANDPASFGRLAQVLNGSSDALYYLST